MGSLLLWVTILVIVGIGKKLKHISIFFAFIKKAKGDICITISHDIILIPISFHFSMLHMSRTDDVSWTNENGGQHDEDV